MAERLVLPAGDVIGSLKAARLFSLLEPDALAAMAPAFEAVRFGPGETIAYAGQVDEFLWVIVSGVVGLVPTSGQPAQEFKAFGDTLGESGVLAGERRSRAAVATEATVLLRIDRAKMLALVAADPDLFDRLVLDDDLRRRLADADLVETAEGEYRVALYRHHWSTLARRLVLPLVLLGVCLAAAYGGVFLLALGPGASPARMLLVTAIALAIPFGIGLWSFFDYYNDALIITSRRVAHVERTPLIDTQRTEALLTRVQDVSTYVPGVAARLLGYGTVVIQTASTGGQIVFRRVARPDEVRAIVVRQLDQARESERRERQDWVDRRVRQALGLANGDPGAAGAGSGVDDASLAAAVEPFWILVFQAVLQMAGYFWPKLRLEEGSVITWRKHWMVLVRSLVVPVAVLGALFAVSLGAARAGRGLPTVALGVGAGLVGLWALWRYENWRNDLYQVTDEHVIDIERLPLGFREERRQARLSQIQDVRYRVPNPLATFLNYGNVVIQTAAEEGNFTFDAVYKPATVQAEIFSRIHAHQDRERQDEQERRADELVVWLRAYHEATGREAEPRSGSHEPGSATAPPGSAHTRRPGSTGGTGPPGGDAPGTTAVGAPTNPANGPRGTPPADSASPHE